MGVQPPEAPGENIRSIGRRCRRGDAHSRAVLIGRDAWPYCRSRLFFLYRFRRSACPSAAGFPGVREGADFRHDNMPVAMAGRKYPFPFRTRKSSSPAPMILLTGESRWLPAFFCLWGMSPSSPARTGDTPVPRSGHLLSCGIAGKYGAERGPGACISFAFLFQRERMEQGRVPSSEHLLANIELCASLHQLSNAYDTNASTRSRRGKPCGNTFPLLLGGKHPPGGRSPWRLCGKCRRSVKAIRSRG